MVLGKNNVIVYSLTKGVQLQNLILLHQWDKLFIYLIACIVSDVLVSTGKGIVEKNMISFLSYN